MITTLSFSNHFFFFAAYVLLARDWMMRKRVMYFRKYVSASVLEECRRVLGTTWWENAAGNCKVQEARNWLVEDAATSKS